MERPSKIRELERSLEFYEIYSKEFSDDPKEHSMLADRHNLLNLLYGGCKKYPTYSFEIIQKELYKLKN